jgi:serine/threonine protein kinase/tetratricopeptide (TPR) repeat protein
MISDAGEFTMSLDTGMRLGHYEILGALGAGGMGEVYRARDLQLEREVAVKVLPERFLQDTEALARFEREARAVAALSHANILAIYDFGRSGTVSYAVMELLQGRTLRQRLEAGAIPARKAIDYAQQIARGLAAAHERGIIHRDLKPENIMISDGGVLKILDFGLAKRTVSALSGETPSMAATEEVSATAAGSILGTVGYMAPEQVRGKAADHRADLFSLGAILYEMLSGQRAFRRESSIETMMAILQEDPSPLPPGRGVPPKIQEIVTHCLEKNPDERFQSARDLAFALQVGERDWQSAGTDSGAHLESGSRIGSSTGGAKEASIAVLPFRNMSADREAEYFSDGMTEEIINTLTKIQSLRVAARTSSFAFKGRDTDVRQIGQELGVGTVLEGSVRQAGRRLRIMAQLIDVANGYHLWSERFDREMEDVFAVQDEIARAIAETLRVRIFSAGDAPLVAPPTPDVEAYNLYLKGRYSWNLRRANLAIQQFEAAIDRDPKYAAAYTGICNSYCVWGFYGGIPTWEAYARARAAAERAQELTPDSPDVHLSLGLIEHYFGWDVVREERELRLAIEGMPRSAEGYFWLSLDFVCTGRPEEALEAARQAVQLEPHSANAQATVGWPYFWKRQFPDAVRELRKAVELEPDAAFPLWSFGLALQEAGETEEAIAVFRRAVEITEGRHSHYIALLGGALARAGRESEARQILSQLRERAKKEYVPPFDFALVLAPLGETQETLSALEKAYDERNGLLWYRIYFPAFDRLRSERRWQAVVEKLARTAPVRPPPAG